MEILNVEQPEPDSDWMLFTVRKNGYVTKTRCRTWNDSVDEPVPTRTILALLDFIHDNKVRMGLFERPAVTVQVPEQIRQRVLGRSIEGLWSWRRS